MTLTILLIYASQILLALSILLATIRILRGPRAQDRILALDTLYVNALLAILILSFRTHENFYIEIALIMSFLGFAATAALAKFLMRGDVIE